jgi:hypothetical protein
VRFTLEFDLGSLQDRSLRVLPLFLSLAAADFRQRSLFGVIDRLFEEQERRRLGTPRSACKSITFDVEPKDALDLWCALQRVERGFEASLAISERVMPEKIEQARESLVFVRKLAELVGALVDGRLRDRVLVSELPN